MMTQKKKAVQYEWIHTGQPLCNVQLILELEQRPYTATLPIKAGICK